MAANISYAHIAKKAAGTSEDNDTNPEIIEVPPVAQDLTSDASATKKTSSKKKSSRARNRKEKKAAKMAAVEAEKAKISESSEAEEPQQPKVFIPAPPPKVNVWHKKSTEVTEEDEANDEQSKDQTAEKAEKANNSGVVKDKANDDVKKEPTPADAAVMKESTADNRPQSVKKPLVSGSSALGSPWKTPQVDVVQVIMIDKQLLYSLF